MHLPLLPLSLSHMQIYYLSPHPPSLLLPAFSLTLTLLTTVTIKTLRKHIHAGGLVWGVGGGGRWEVKWGKAGTEDCRDPTGRKLS